jgi:hypothetical protein
MASHTAFLSQQKRTPFGIVKRMGACVAFILTEFYTKEYLVASTKNCLQLEQSLEIESN